MTDDLTRRLAEALRELLVADPDMPGYDAKVTEAEGLVSECEAAGILPPTEP